MNRRQFLRWSLAGTAVTLTGAGGWLAVADKAQLPSLLDVVTAIEQNQALAVQGTWSVAKTLYHCAQSIEMSMTGYPVHKSEGFKQTIGQLALSVFAKSGSMTHGLSEPIPGALNLPDNDDVLLAKQRLVDAAQVFSDYTNTLQPHFAYGALNKEAYEMAHVLHILDHIPQLRV
ncbi:MAG: hypothetical protein ACI8WB_006258 [Phenylobacterium sp.]|jgi:hypothetical protein